MQKNKHLTALFLFLNWTYVFNCMCQESIILTKRQECDLEMILNNGFYPLTGFLNQSDYQSVLANMRLENGSVWPIPVTLDIPQSLAIKLRPGDTVLLKDAFNVPLASLLVQDIWKPDKLLEAQLVFNTLDITHPGVNYLLHETQDYYIGGPITLIRMPRHYDFMDERLSPDQLKEYFKSKGITKVIGFQTRNPMHKAHYTLTLNAAKSQDAHLLIQPVIGVTKIGDFDYVTRMRCYKKILDHYPQNSVTLNGLPLAMRMAGPKEALWHALIRKNYGCTHFIVGRDHAGPGNDKDGRPFYGLYDAQDLVKQYAPEIGIELVASQEMVFVQEDDCFKPLDQVPLGKTILNISGTLLRTLFAQGQTIPPYFSFPEVIEELQKVYPSLEQQGLTIFFTGLSGSGKTTLAYALAERLREVQERNITLLDGDVIRQHLSSELNFSKEHRSLNVRRVGYVASEICKNGGLAICSLIAPYNDDREFNRQLIKQYGGYIEVYLNTSLAICEQRDVKKLYEKARLGIIQNFTGISDPYETPQQPDLVINTENVSIEKALCIIIDYLTQKGYLTEK